METVKSIQELAELKQRVEFLEITMLKPRLTNLNYIPMLYDWFRSISVEIKYFHGRDTTGYKQVFLYCILMLYCPRAFSGNHMTKGIRQSLSLLFNVSPSHVSNMIKNLSFYYDRYIKFSSECDAVLRQLESKINENGLL